MQEKEKQKLSLWKRFKEIWSIPRYRSLITLGLYLFFFLFIYVYIMIVEQMSSSLNDSTNSIVNPFITYKEMQSYEYTYDITSIDDLVPTTYQVVGTYVDNIDTFTVNSHKFYISNGIISSKEEGMQITDILPINLMMLTPSNLSVMFTNDKLDSKTSYENGDSKVVFKIPASEFNISYVQDLNLLATNFISITVYIENNRIVKIHLDLYDIMKLVFPNIENYIVDITYSNINTIKSVENF